MTGRTKLPNPRRSGEPITLDWIKSNCEIGVRAIPMTECWTWLGATDRDGYGVTSRGKANLRTHRESFALFYDRKPGDVLDHVCRNRACVNPVHLDEVSSLENNIRGNGKMIRGACPKCGSDRLAKRSDRGTVTAMRCIPCRTAYSRAWYLANRATGMSAEHG